MGPLASQLLLASLVTLAAVLVVDRIRGGAR